MGFRRVKMLTNGDYWQPLRLSSNTPLVLTLGAQFNNVIYRFGEDLKPIEVQVAAQYSETGDNLNFIAYLQRNPGSPIAAGSCSFSIDQMTGDGLWASISNDVLTGTEDNEGRWTSIVPAADVITNLCMGKTTLRVRATLQRASKVYRREVFINHLGIGEAASFFRSKILRLETFKKDE